MQELERRLQRGLNLLVLFKFLIKILLNSFLKDMRAMEGKRRSSIKRDPIGSTENSIRRHRSSLKRSLLHRRASEAEIKVGKAIFIERKYKPYPYQVCLTRLNSEELVAFNPLLSDVDPMTRRAYARFKSALDKYNQENSDKKVEVNEEKEEKEKRKESLKKMNQRNSIKKLILEKTKSLEQQVDC